MEVLQARPVRQRAIARLLPQPLAHRVGRRLPRQPQVAVQLEAQERLLHGHVVAQEGPGAARVPGALAHSGQARQLGRALLAQVHPDVEHHPRGAQPLGVEHAEAVARVVLEAQVGHEPLGVQRPALAVPAHPAGQAPPGVELVAQPGLHADLQVVARHALVEDGGALLPGGEVLGARRHRPPHAARPGEVVARPGVVDAAGGRRGDAALQGAQRGGDVEVDAVERRHGPIRGLLHPVPQRRRAVDGARGVGVQPVHGLAHARPGPVEPLGDGPLLGVDGGQALPAPFVGLVQVDDGAQELPAESLVALAPDGVGPARFRQDLLGEEVGEAGVAPPGDGGGLAQLGGQGGREGRAVGGGGAVDERRVGARGLAGLVAGLGDRRPDLAAGGDVAARARQAQAPGVLVQRPGDGAQGGGEVVPVLLGGGGQVVEAVAQGLDGAVDVVEGAQVLAGVGEVQAHTQALAHGGDGDAVDVVGRLDAVQLAQGGAVQVVSGGQALRRVVVELAAPARQAVVDGELRGELGQAGHVALGDRVDGGGGAGGAGGLVRGVGHGPSLVERRRSPIGRDAGRARHPLRRALAQNRFAVHTRTRSCTSEGGVMTVVSASEARANLFGLIERVNEDAAPVEITSRRGDAVLISRNEFEALEETAHLLRSPANAARLLESLTQAREGWVEEHELLS